MRSLTLIVVGVLGGIAAATSSANAAAPGCDLSNVKTIGELNDILSRRAAEVVSRAAAPGWAKDVRLKQLVAPSANFSSGIGDVRLPLGAGTPGARALAKKMNADSFRFFGWDYIPTPVQNACGKNEIKIEFVDTRRENAFPVTFTFEAGRVVSAEGWLRSLQTGRIAPVRE